MEAIILSLQKIIGPKFFLSKKYKQKYDYYRKQSDLKESDLEQDCVICLDTLAKIGEDLGNNQNKITKFHFEKWINDCITKIENRKKKNKPYMVTPCHHIFHVKCLELWMEQKNECPYCRQKIPPAET